MSKLIKTLLVLFIITILGISIYSVKATYDDEECETNSTENYEDTSSDIEETDEADNESENENIIKENASDGSLQTLSPSSVTSVTNKNNYSNANLELNNILCIILISIGVLLILFAIAILIRLKR